MPVKLWQPPRPRTPFAPNWTLPLYHDSLPDPKVNRALAQIALEQEETLRGGIEPIPIAGVEAGTTARWHGFNIFGWQQPAMQAFQAFVLQAYRTFMQRLRMPRPKTYVQGWVNVLRQGEQLTPHCHDQTPLAFLSGNYCVAAQGTSTLYFPPYVYKSDERFDRKAALSVTNEPGLVTLFPSAAFHCTTPHQTAGERITLAFDIHLEDRDAMGKRGCAGLHVPFDAGCG